MLNLVSRQTMVQNLHACSRCVREAGGNCASGAIVVCPVDAQPITGHAQTGECAKGLLRRSTVPPLPVQHIPDDFDVEQERRRMAQGGCCGKPPSNNPA